MPSRLKGFNENSSHLLLLYPDLIQLLSFLLTNGGGLNQPKVLKQQPSTIMNGQENTTSNTNNQFMICDNDLIQILLKLLEKIGVSLNLLSSNGDQ